MNQAYCLQKYIYSPTKIFFSFQVCFELSLKPLCFVESSVQVKRSCTNNFVHFEYALNSTLSILKRRKGSKIRTALFDFSDELATKEFVPLILTFVSLFSKPVWESALVLVGAILAPGKRTVSAILQ